MSAASASASSPMARARWWAGGFLPGARARRVQVVALAAAWAASNDEALGADGPLWVALGDSATQAVGASDQWQGWVGQVLERLRSDEPTWRVVNLSVTGAVAADVVDDQLARLSTLPHPALITCAIGSNDLLKRTRAIAQETSIDTIAAALAAGADRAVLATCPQGVNGRRAQILNAHIRATAARHGLAVADLWTHTGAPWRGKYSADQFHPNDTGYADWAAAFLEALGVAPSE